MLAFIALQTAAVRQTVPMQDSYRYGIKTLELLGVPEQAAHEQSLRMLCEPTARAKERSRSLDPRRRRHETSVFTRSLDDCLRASPTKIEPSSPRYTQIFDTRPGYPLLCVPAVKLFGLRKGMVLTSLALGAAGGLLVFFLMSLAGLPRGPSLLAQVLYYTLPTGYWASRTLSEGAMLLATLATLIGAWLLLQRRIGVGLAVTIGAGLSGFAVKYAQIPLLGIALTGAAVGVWFFDRQRRHAGTIVLAATSLVAIATGLLVPAAMGWPDFHESMQDTFTNHFRSGPDVADPVRLLVGLNGALWSQWLQEQALRPLLLLAVGTGAVALWRWSRPFALIVLAAAATGIATEVAHPVWIEDDRLYVQLWLAGVFGLPLLWPSLEVGRGVRPGLMVDGIGCVGDRQGVRSPVAVAGASVAGLTSGSDGGESWQPGATARA